MTRDKVLAYKEELDYSLKQMQTSEQIFETAKNHFHDAQVEYRIAEVKYVLGKLDTLMYNDKLQKEDIQKYISHCINCLNGNIDGTVLDLEGYEG